MTWEIVAGLITLCTFGLMIGKVIANNTAVIVELKVSVDALAKSMDKQEDKQEEIAGTVSNHETRICVLEEKER